MTSIKEVNQRFSGRNWATKATRHNEMIKAGIHEHDTGWTEYILSRRVSPHEISQALKYLASMDRPERNLKLVELWESNIPLTRNRPIETQ